jgi:hypothetical protein
MNIGSASGANSIERNLFAERYSSTTLAAAARVA